MAYIGDPRKTTDVVPLATSLAQTQAQMKKRQPHWAEILGATMAKVGGVLERKEQRIAGEEQAEVEAWFKQQEKAQEFDFKQQELDNAKILAKASDLSSQAKWFEAETARIKANIPAFVLMNIGDGRQIGISVNSDGTASHATEAMLNESTYIKNLTDRWGIFDYMTGNKLGELPMGPVPEGWQLQLSVDTTSALAFDPKTGNLIDVSDQVPVFEQRRLIKEEIERATVEQTWKKIAIEEKALLLEQKTEEWNQDFKILEAARDEKWKNIHQNFEKVKFEEAVRAQVESERILELAEKRHRLTDLHQILVATAAMNRDDILTNLQVLESESNLAITKMKQTLDIEQQNFENLQRLLDRADEKDKFQWQQLVDRHAMLIKNIEMDIAITGMENEQTRLSMEVLESQTSEQAAWYATWIKLDKQGEAALNQAELELLGIREPVEYAPTTQAEALEYLRLKNELNAKLGVGGAMTMEDRKVLMDYERGVQVYMANLNQEQKIAFEELSRGYDLEYLEKETGIEWIQTQKEYVLKANLADREPYETKDGTYFRYNKETGQMEIFFKGLDKPQVMNIKTDTGLVAVGLVYPGDTEVTWTDTFDPDTQAKDMEMINKAWYLAETMVGLELGPFAQLDPTEVPGFRRAMTAQFVRLLLSYGLTEERALELANPNYILQYELGGKVYFLGPDATSDYITGDVYEGKGGYIEQGDELIKTKVVEQPKDDERRLTAAEIEKKITIQTNYFKQLNSLEATMKLQYRLQDLGVYKGEVDGVWSVAVERALAIAIRRNLELDDILIILVPE